MGLWDVKEKKDEEGSRKNEGKSFEDLEGRSLKKKRKRQGGWSSEKGGSSELRGKLGRLGREIEKEKKHQSLKRRRKGGRHGSS